MMDSEEDEKCDVCNSPLGDEAAEAAVSACGYYRVCDACIERAPGYVRSYLDGTDTDRADDARLWLDGQEV
jgi:hypothetical protein